MEKKRIVVSIQSLHELEEPCGNYLSGFSPIQKVERKLGPIEIGRNHDYDAADYKLQQDNLSFLKERLLPRKKVKISEEEKNLDDGHEYCKYGKFEAPRKLGPREIGRNSDYDVATYDWKDGWHEDFLKPKRSMPIYASNFKFRSAPSFVDDGHDYLSVGPGAAPRKLGPRDIGRIKDWKPADYGIDLKEIIYEDFMKPRLSKRSRRKQKAPRSKSAKAPTIYRKFQSDWSEKNHSKSSTVYRGTNNKFNEKKKK